MKDDFCKGLSATLAIALVVIVLSAAMFSYFNRRYLAAWYVRVTEAKIVSPFLNQRVEAFKLWSGNTEGRRTIVFVGDSLIDTFSWEEQFKHIEDIEVLNRGIYGDTIEGLHERFEISFLMGAEPRIFLMIGTNNMDVGDSCSSEFLENYQLLLSRLLESGVPSQEIFIHSILPVRRRDKSNLGIANCNEALERYALDLGIGYIDLFSALVDELGNLNEKYSLEDGLHLNSEGYRVWLDFIERYIVE